MGNSLSFGDKVGCAGLVVSIFAAIAAWLVVPGVFPSHQKPVIPERQATQQRIITEPSQKLPKAIIGQLSKHSQASVRERTAPPKTIDLIPQGSPLWQAIFLSPPPNPHLRIDNFTFDFGSCDYFAASHNLVCYATATNHYSETQFRGIWCPRAAFVDGFGNIHSASQCSLAGDVGSVYSNANMAPEVGYGMTVTFEGITLYEHRLRNIEFGFAQGVGFRDVPVVFW